jgi:hypothetical protein
MVAEEKYTFEPRTKRKLTILFAVGLVLFLIGVFMAMNSGGGHEAEGHASAEVSKNMLASIQEGAEAAEPAAEHHGSAPWLKRIYTSLWQNNIFFTGIGVIGLFFIAIQYAAQAGWSAPIKRIPLAIGHWIPFAGILMIVLWFVVSGDLFHWTHHDLYDTSSASFDKIINGKSGYFFWPLAAGSFPIFFVLRMVIFFGLWYLFFTWIKKEMLAEDLDGSPQHWYNARKLSAVFLIIFAVSSSVAAWDWV